MKGKLIWKKMGKTDEEIADMTKELNAITLPEGSGYLLETFRELSDTRRYGFAGNPEPISYLEIKAYVDLLDVDLTPWEIQVIKEMDGAFINEYNDIQAKRTPNEPAQPTVQGRHQPT